jgi:hypothetical protein
MRKIIVALVVIGLLAFAAAYAASPYLAFYQLQTAAKSGNRDVLEDAVDFPSVREDFKAQLNAAFMAKMQKDQNLRANPFAAIGMLLVPAVLDRMIDAYITPQGISQMVLNARTPEPGQPKANPDSDKHITLHSGYVSLNRFKVTAVNDTEPGKPIAFVMERRGFFAWKLIRIELPLQDTGK